MGLRGLALVARFALTVYMAKFLTLSAVGELGMIYGAVSIAPALLGLGLNFSLNREIIGLSISDAGSRIRDRLSVTGAMVFLASGVVLIFSLCGFPLKVHFLAVTLAVAALEVIAFDINMSLLSLRMPIFANVLLFIRTASWIFPYVIMGLFTPKLRSFPVLLCFWLAAITVMYAVLLVKLRSWPWAGIFGKPIDYRWIWERVRASGLIYASDLGIVGSSFLDRFVVVGLLGMEVAGVFTFFWSLSNAAQLLVNVGLIQPSLPRLVDKFMLGGKESLKQEIRRDLYFVTGVGVVLSVGIYFAGCYALPRLGHPQLLAYPLLLPLMLVAAVLRLGSDVLNYGLYACGMDRPWAVSNLLGVLLSAIFTLIGIFRFGLQGVGAAMVGTSVALFVTRLYFLFGEKHSPRAIEVAEEVWQ